MLHLILQLTKEILLALRLEKFFDKEDILEAYLNSSTFGRNSSGQNIAGVEAASQGIFGVSAKDLNLPQAAFIAGLPQSPFMYTPFTAYGEVKSEEGLKPGLDRQKLVLKRMLEMNYITEQEYEDAVNYNLLADFIPPQESPIDTYAYLTFEAEDRAINILMQRYYEKDGYTKKDIDNSEILYERYYQLAYKDLRQNGYKIYTTIDKEIYDEWQKITKEYTKNMPTHTVEKTDPETGDTVHVQEPVEVGAMLIENATGKIIAFAGGSDYERNNINHATKIYRSNGSTMKPLLVYAPAIDMGIIGPGSPLADVEATYAGGYSPKNFNRSKYYGIVSARTALTHSYNVSTVFLYNKILNRNPVGNYLEKFNLEKLAPADYTNLSMALGAMEWGMSVEENTNAFATFGNNGQFVDAYMIEKIEDKDGNIIYENKPEAVQVYSPQAAYLTVDMMRDVVKKGTARSIPGMLNFSMDLAGKTGTSQNFRDQWFIGLNPNVTLGVWIGFDNKDIYKRDSIPRGVNHLPYWARLMNATNSIKPDLVGASDRFEMPDGIVKKSVCSISGLLPSDKCSKADLVNTDYFIEKHIPSSVDTSFVDGKYVAVGNKKYLAHATTPDEFIKTGAILNVDALKKLYPNINVNQLIASEKSLSDLLIQTETMQENGRAPAPPSINQVEALISWNHHDEHDVIGYRIYNVTNQGKQHVASIPADSTLSYSLPFYGNFAVTAVDISGNESELSDIVSTGPLDWFKENESMENMIEMIEDAFASHTNGVFLN